MSSLETRALIAWKSWGANWGKFTICKKCGESKYCRGTRRDNMICLSCFDLNPPNRKR
jgi:hypothetical protein